MLGEERVVRYGGPAAAIWAIGLALDVTIEKSETLQRHGVKTVAVFRD